MTPWRDYPSPTLGDFIALALVMWAAAWLVYAVLSWYAPAEDPLAELRRWEEQFTLDINKAKYRAESVEP